MVKVAMDVVKMEKTSEGMSSGECGLRAKVKQTTCTCVRVCMDGSAWLISLQMHIRPHECVRIIHVRIYARTQMSMRARDRC